SSIGTRTTQTSITGIRTKIASWVSDDAAIRWLASHRWATEPCATVFDPRIDFQGRASNASIAASRFSRFGADTNKRLSVGTQIEVAAPGELAIFAIGV